MADSPVEEKFAPNGGQVSGAAGLVVVALFVGTWVTDRDRVPLWVLAMALFAAVLIWSSMLRPRVWVEPGTLVLRNMLDTTRIPLAAVEQVVVRQVMAVRAGDKRYVSSGVGRTLRQVLKGSATQRARGHLAGVEGMAAESISAVEPGMSYGDYVELRVRDLAKADRTRRGVRASSPEASALAGEVVRSRAWPEIAALAATGLFVLVALLVR
jgi:hypothetical protein